MGKGKRETNCTKKYGDALATLPVTLGIGAGAVALTALAPFHARLLLLVPERLHRIDSRRAQRG